MSRELVMAVWVVAVMLLVAGCAGGDPGTPSNHPILWGLGIAFAVICIGGGLWMVGNRQRRHERREDRREKRDERGDPI